MCSDYQLKYCVLNFQLSMYSVASFYSFNISITHAKLHMLNKIQKEKVFIL